MISVTVHLILCIFSTTNEVKGSKIFPLQPIRSLMTISYTIQQHAASVSLETDGGDQSYVTDPIN